MTRPHCSNNIMPSRKKKSKAKGRKPAVGKGGANKAAEKVTVNEQKKGTLIDSEMQRLKIGEQKGDEDDVEAMLEEAIKLAAIEEQEMKVKEKQNCTHGYNPSSIFQARFCEDFLKTFLESYYASTRRNSRNNRVGSAIDAFRTAVDNSITTTNVARDLCNNECINPFCLAEGTKFILDGNSDDARLCAVLALVMKSITAAELPSQQKEFELVDADEHTLVQFFRKQIPCSCLDEKYKEVKSITKMGICFNEISCPLPDRKAVRSKMFRCTGCLSDYYVSYCSRECQEAHWPVHKKHCGKTTQEIAAMRSNE